METRAMIIKESRISDSVPKLFILSAISKGIDIGTESSTC